MSERIGTFCEKCRQVVCICSKQPTTVRGWLETLPEPLRSEALKEWGNKAESKKHEINTLSWAVWNVVELYKPLSSRSLYWCGVHCYLQRIMPADTMMGGYNAAKAAYETKVVPQTKENMFGCFAKSQETESTNGKEYGVSFVSVSAERLAELEAKEKVFDDMVIALGRYYSRKEQGNG